MKAMSTQVWDECPDWWDSAEDIQHNGTLPCNIALKAAFRRPHHLATG